MLGPTNQLYSTLDTSNLTPATNCFRRHPALCIVGKRNRLDAALEKTRTHHDVIKGLLSGAMLENSPTETALSKRSDMQDLKYISILKRRQKRSLIAASSPQIVYYRVRRGCHQTHQPFCISRGRLPRHGLFQNRQEPLVRQSANQCSTKTYTVLYSPSKCTPLFGMEVANHITQFCGLRKQEQEIPQ